MRADLKRLKRDTDSVRSYGSPVAAEKRLPRALGAQPSTAGVAQVDGISSAAQATQAGAFIGDVVRRSRGAGASIWLGDHRDRVSWFLWRLRATASIPS